MARPAFIRRLVLAFSLLAGSVLSAGIPAFADDPVRSAGPEAGQQEAAPAAPTDAEVEQFRSWLVAAWNKQDVDQILTQVTPDIIVTWQDGSLSQGKDEVRKYIEQKTEGPNSIVQRVTANPAVEGRRILQDHVFSWGRMNDVFVLRHDGAELPFNSRFSAILVRQEGRLLLAGIHFSANVFDNPVQSLAVKKTRNIAGGTGALIGVLAALVVYRLTKKKSV